MATVWAVADSDSYLKWSLATVAALPAEWSRRQLLLRSPIQPSAAQIRAVTDREVPVVSSLELAAAVRREPPDVLLLACTGPVVATLCRWPGIRDARSVLVAGLPGVSIPASPRAVRHRSGCDVLIVHSRRERAAFAALAAELAPGLAVGLARLPFLRDEEPPRPQQGEDVVFAAQAAAPPQRVQRTAVLRALAEVSPAGSAVVKLRGRSAEQQTHRERYPYPALWAELLARGEVAAGSVRFTTGSLADTLASARGLATVSSTAAVEAMAAGLGVVVLSDFGVTAELVNLVYSDSGCLGTLADVRVGRFRRPSERWLAENYLHPAEESDWLQVLANRLAAGPRPRTRVRTAAPLASARSAARLLLPPATWPIVRGVSDLWRR